MPLTDLPDPCLLAVLRCLEDDPVSVCSAARAHTKLHQAAGVALRSITAHIKRQQQEDSVLTYIAKHAQHIQSISLTSDGSIARVRLRQLPALLQLHSLHLDSVRMQLGPGASFPGVLVPIPALKQLRLGNCWLLDEDARAALSQLPAALEHLSPSNLHTNGALGAGVLQAQTVRTSIAGFSQLTQLTFLGLSNVELLVPGRARNTLQPRGLPWHAARLGRDEDDPFGDDGDESIDSDEEAGALQPLQALTGLQDLRLGYNLAKVVTPGRRLSSAGYKVTNSELSGVHMGWACSPFRIVSHGNAYWYLEVITSHCFVP
jgi:hypothetical protein